MKDPIGMVPALHIFFRAAAALRRRFVGHRGGNVLIVVALIAPALISATGFSIDYAYATYLKQSLDKAIDTAVLASTSQSAASSGAGYTDTVWLTNYGLKVFQGNTSKLGVSVTPTLTVASNGTGGVVANGSYTYAVPTFFSAAIGMPTIRIAGTASATANPTTYLNYYIVLDISQSMGIGATAADMTNLYNLTKAKGNEGCVFGCHVKAGSEKFVNETLAHNASPRINLRIDAAISAIQTIIADAQAAAGSQQNIKIGLYTMNQDPSTGNLLTTVSTPSSNYSNLATLAGGIVLGNNNSGGTGDSNFPAQLSQFNALIPTNGSGASAASPKNYVFIISDAAGDTPDSSCKYGHCMTALSPSNCTTMKAKATVGTIYTTYLTIYANNNPAQGQDSRYADLVAPISSQFASNMQSCATNSNFYYEASDGPALNAAMKTLFASTLKTARLTQ